jgi:AcrR family transcriptional regulator
MKRHGYLIEKVTAPENLEGAFQCVMKGKRRNRTVRYYHRNKEKILAEIAEEIAGDRYQPKGFYSFTVKEHEKTRDIQSLPFRDRIALHAIMSVLDELFRPMLIRDTYASIAGRGIHDGLHRVRKALRDRQGSLYCLKLDLQKFYPSVDQSLLIEMLARKIKDERMMNTLRRVIGGFDKGLPIGFHSSQQLGNFYLFPLDHYVKAELGVKYYFRYCDDVVILSASKEELREVFGKVRTFIEERLRLTVKGNYQIFPVESRGIDFLGYVIRHDYTLLRKRIKQRAARRLASVKSKKRRSAVIGALWGWAKHANSRTLLKKLLGMKDFKELGIKYEPKDGKKRFTGELVRLGDLQNCEVVVHDFETGITTKEGEGRYIIEYEMDGKRNKFITNSEEMKNILDQVREAEALPFKTTIKREVFGQNKTKYVFT